MHLVRFPADSVLFPRGQDAVASQQAKAPGRTGNPVGYTRDTGFIEDALRRKGKLRETPVRPWETNQARKPAVFGVDKHFFKDGVVKASDGAVVMRGEGGNDLLFDFSQVPGPKRTAAVKIQRRKEQRATAVGNRLVSAAGPDTKAPYNLDDISVASDAESVDEDTRLTVGTGHLRWMTTPHGHTNGQPSPVRRCDALGSRAYGRKLMVTSPIPLCSVMIDLYVPTVTVKSWMEAHHIGGYYPRLQQLGVSVAEDLKYVDTMTMALDADIVRCRKV
jgi:hypothetical protein